MSSKQSFSALCLVVMIVSLTVMFHADANQCIDKKVQVIPCERQQCMDACRAKHVGQHPQAQCQYFPDGDAICLCGYDC
ncbi:hypothetical protein ACHQM5_024329 [Ranunculus cassubicifolius]